MLADVAECVNKLGNDGRRQTTDHGRQTTARKDVNRGRKSVVGDQISMVGRLSQAGLHPSNWMFRASNLPVGGRLSANSNWKMWL